MNGQPIAILMARESTRRKISRPQPEPPRPRRHPRRAIALALQFVAHRLDPSVTTAPARVQVEP
jgi:hypothetical protein